MLATPESQMAPTRKKLLSRSARYSGLLNVLDFAVADIDTESQLTALLAGAGAWLAFNVTQQSIPAYAKSAIDAGVKRAIFTLELPVDRINETAIPEFDAAIHTFEQAGGAFTGIRHGVVVPGDEDNPYEIVNATANCLDGKSTVERGVLGRVVAELLRIDASSNKACGLFSSGAFAGAYLSVLRSAGLTRQQEVEKIFSGGIQKMAQLTDAEKKRNEEHIALMEQKKVG